MGGTSNDAERTACCCHGCCRLKLFRKGVVSDYGGPRDAPGIVRYMLAQNGPAAKPISSSEKLDTFVANDKHIGVVAFVEQGSSAETIYLAVAEQVLTHSFQPLFTHIGDGGPCM